ncbi:hypothetical protein BGX34_007048 [Mortierella sp. NVP85]|nr:hypothetical protein BGX34_007048 [Mortierella sp. NVP85]
MTHQGTSSDADGQQGFEETDQPKEAPKADQQEEQDFIPLEDDDDSEAESDIEIDLSTPSDWRGARRRRAQQQQRKVPKHCCKSNSKVYDNISVYAPPDSNLIFRCSQKRANWYLSRNLARSLSPTSIHLNFAPAGQGHVNDPYYLEERENKCVVCGQMTEEVGATMLHVIPEQYRKWFPIRLKSHSSHDILVACPECNADWDREAAIVRKEIVKLYKIPLEGVGWIKDQDAGAAKRSAGAVVADWSRQWDEYRLQKQSIPADSHSQDVTSHDGADVHNGGSTTSNEQDSKRQKKAKTKKQNVIPAERLQFLERNVYDWWVKTHKNTTADNAGASSQSQLKRTLPSDFSEALHAGDNDSRKKKAKPESSAEMDANLETGTIAPSISSSNTAPAASPQHKNKNMSVIEIPDPPPGHSTMLDKDMLEAALGAQASYKGPDYKEHGELVVAQVMATSPEFHQDEDESQETLKMWKEAKPLTPAREGWRDVSEFIRTWRKEFLDRIRPEHLSSEWKVDNPV